MHSSRKSFTVLHEIIHVGIKNTVYLLKDKNTAELWIKKESKRTGSEKPYTEQATMWNRYYGNNLPNAFVINDALYLPYLNTEQFRSPKTDEELWYCLQKMKEKNFFMGNPRRENFLMCNEKVYPIDFGQITQIIENSNTKEYHDIHNELHQVSKNIFQKNHTKKITELEETIWSTLKHNTIVKKLIDYKDQLKNENTPLSQQKSQ